MCKTNQRNRTMIKLFIYNLDNHTFIFHHSKSCLKTIIVISLLFLFTNNVIAQSKSGEDMYDIGNVYYNKGDYKTALTYFLNGAREGDFNCQNMLGGMYQFGKGVKKDIAKAIDYYSEAAEKGQMYAQYNLGRLYYHGIEVPQNYNKAITWIRKSADQGFSSAQNYMGLIYGNGQGVEKNDYIAAEWYRKAAIQNNAAAQNNLGYSYTHGKGVNRDYSLAVYWYGKSAEQNNAEAQYVLGYLYLNGLGIAKDISKAVYWYRKAADQGHKDAVKQLKEIEANSSSNTYIVSNNPSAEDDVDKNIPSSNERDNNCFVVIIGNEIYKNEVFVPFASNDAKIFKEYVEKTLGVSHDQIRFIENAGYNDIRMAVNWLIQAMKICRGKGKAIVYYAGHGIPNESDMSSYLLPVDGIGNDPGSAYSLKDMYEKLGSVEAQSIMVFLDACFSGSRREGGMLASARGVAIKAKPSEPKGNMIVFTAVQGDETAYPYKDKKHGMFTYFLLKKLQETKGDVSLGDLSDYLTEEVGRQSFIKNNKMQTPTVNVSSSLQNSWRNMKLK